MPPPEVGINLLKNHEEEFGYLSGRVYLDHAGATLYSRSQLAAVQSDLTANLYGNPHTRSLASRRTTDAVDQARFRLLQHFNTSSDEYSVVFTSGATGALALLADAFQFNGTADRPGSFVYLQESHTSVLGMRETVGQNVTVSALQSAEAARVLVAHEAAGKDAEEVGSMSKPVHETANSKTGPAVETAPANAALNSSGSAADSRTGESVPTCEASSSGHRRGLFAYPAQCNFSGRKYPLRWVAAAQARALDGLEAGTLVRGSGHVTGCRWYCVLDAASHVATNELDLGAVQPDFVCLSFYKIFGYPTGLGALLVHRRARHTLQKRYFGGGTVQVSLAGQDFHVPRSELHERLEDGTLSYLAIAAVPHGLDALRRLAGGVKVISRHVFALARYTYCHLSSLRHTNGSPVARIYADSAYDDVLTQGGIIAFNLMRPDGQYYGSTEVEKFAGLYDIDLRTGCFCNPGACQRHLGHSSDTVRRHFQAGHVCGDETDLIGGLPTGACRVSFGYMSRRSDADRLLSMVRECFLCAGQTPPPEAERLGRAAEARHREEEQGGAVVNGGAAESGGEELWEEARSDAGPVETVLESGESGSSRQNVISGDGPGGSCRTKSRAPVLDNHGRSKVAQPNALTNGVSGLSSPSRNSAPDTPRLSQLVVYPVKSCGGQEARRWPLGRAGLLYDRCWMVVGSGGWALTQKRQPRLCLVRPEVRLSAGQLLLHADGHDSLQLPLEISPAQSVTSADLCESRVCGDRVGGLDCGEEAADWLTDVLGVAGVRLFRQSPASQRLSKVNGTFGPLSLVNESPYVLLNLSSVQALRAAIEARDVTYSESEEELVSRFRPNLVVSGLPAYEEDNMRSITFGTTTMQVSGGCSRCQMVCVHQGTAERSPEPLRTLSATRGRRMPFGVHLSLAEGGAADSVLLEVGQTVRWQREEERRED